MTFLDILMVLLYLGALTGSCVIYQNSIIKIRIRLALRNIARKKNVVFSVHDELKKIKWFKKNVYKTNKLLFFSAFIPGINCLIAICLPFYLIGDLKGEKLLKKYGKEFDMLVKAEVKEDNTIINTKTPENYFVRYGKNGHLNTICFTMDEYNQVVIQDLFGDIKNESSVKQLEIVYALLAQIRNGNVNGLAFSSNLLSTLISDTEGDAKPVSKKEQSLLRRRKH